MRISDWSSDVCSSDLYLLLGAVAISLTAWVVEGREEVPFEAIVIAVIVVVNAVLGYVQEARAEQAVAALQRMAAPTTTVLRDGAEQRLDTTELVPGDVILLAEGDADRKSTSLNSSH